MTAVEVLVMVLELRQKQIEKPNYNFGPYRVYYRADLIDADLAMPLMSSAYHLKSGNCTTLLQRLLAVEGIVEVVAVDSQTEPIRVVQV